MHVPTAGTQASHIALLHVLTEALRSYIDGGITEDRKGWLFRTSRGHLSVENWSQDRTNVAIALAYPFAGITEALTKTVEDLVPIGMSNSMGS